MSDPRLSDYKRAISLGAAVVQIVCSILHRQDGGCTYCDETIQRLINLHTEIEHHEQTCTP